MPDCEMAISSGIIFPAAQGPSPADDERRTYPPRGALI
jgi:hypothetical protein